MSVIKWDNLRGALQRAALVVRVDAQTNLTKTRAIRQNDGKIRQTKQSATGTLLRSLKEGELTADGNVFSISLAPDMEYYGYFIDEGVAGLRHRPSVSTPYSFKNPYFGKAMISSLMKWFRYKRIRIRDEKGRFAKGKLKSKAYESLAFAIARSIKYKGIARSEFLTQPMTKMQEQLPDFLEEAILKDFDNYMTELFKK
jgi:hypothetical protein